MGRNGRIYALDSTNGNVIYTRTLSFGGVHDASWKILKLFVTKSKAGSPDEEPLATLVASRLSPNVSYVTMTKRRRF